MEVREIVGKFVFWFVSMLIGMFIASVWGSWVVLFVIWFFERLLDFVRTGFFRVLTLGLIFGFSSMGVSAVLEWILGLKVKIVEVKKTGVSQ